MKFSECLPFKTPEKPQSLRFTCILSLLGSNGVFICNVAWKRKFVKVFTFVVDSQEQVKEEGKQANLIFSPPALNLVVAFFQPGRRHLLPVRPGHVPVTNLPEHHIVTSPLQKLWFNSRVKIMGVVSTSQVSNVFSIPQDTFQPKQAHLDVQVVTMKSLK